MIYTYQDVSAGKVVGPVDVCIIGSGAGGSVMAYYLAKAGNSVAVLEKGAYYPPEELGRKEVTLLTRIEGMTIFTPVTGEHTRISLITGECYGGGTVASESVTWDFPKVVLDDWEKLGLTSWARTNHLLGPYQEELNKRLNVAPVASDHHNMCNWLLKVGAEREGIAWKSVDRPVTECLRCGNCTQGCYYGVKQDSANTFLTWAQDYQAEMFVGAKVNRVTINYPSAEDQPYQDKLKNSTGSAKRDFFTELGNRAKGAPAKFTVTAEVFDAKKPARRDLQRDTKGLTVHARQVVMAAGPLGSSRLLLKSKINPNGVVGKRFTTHPTAEQTGRFGHEVPVRGWDGINDSIEVHHFADLNRHQPYFDPDRHGFLYEANSSLPWGMANLLPGVGQEHLARMRDMNYYAGIELNRKTDSYGTITEDGVKFDLSERDNECMLFGTYIAARLFFRVGAKEVYTGIPGLILTSPGQLDEIFKKGRGKGRGYMQKQANLYSGHVFGGLVMGADPKQSFADETGECHAIKGLWAADGSVFPTNVGVNCAMSIMFAARKIADDFIAKGKGK